MPTQSMVHETAPFFYWHGIQSNPPGCVLGWAAGATHYTTPRTLASQSHLEHTNTSVPVSADAISPVKEAAATRSLLLLFLIDYAKYFLRPTPRFLKFARVGSVPGDLTPRPPHPSLSRPLVSAHGRSLICKVGTDRIIVNGRKRPSRDWHIWH